MMEEMENSEPVENMVLFDSHADTKNYGDFSGALIIKFKGHTPEIIFSDNLKLDENLFETRGLLVGVKEGKGFSYEQGLISEKSFENIDYIVKIPESIVKEFDDARFSTSFPNIVRFLHTACLFMHQYDNLINHLEFVQGEILNRPLVLKRDGSIYIADRLVISENNEPILYDSIVISKNEDSSIDIYYEPFVSVILDDITYILLLGAENF
jgi:hypothetical protein